MAGLLAFKIFVKVLFTGGASLICMVSGNNEPYHDCSRDLYDRVVRFEYLYYEGYWMYPYNMMRDHGPSLYNKEKDFYNSNDVNVNGYRAAIHKVHDRTVYAPSNALPFFAKDCGGGWVCFESRNKDWRFFYLSINTRFADADVALEWSLNPQISGNMMHKVKCTDCSTLKKCQIVHQNGLKKYYSTRQGYIKACATCGEGTWFNWRIAAPVPSDQYRIIAVSDCKRNVSFAAPLTRGASVQQTFQPYYSSTEDMSFEFKKAFAKATELKSLAFPQQWTMSDDSAFTSESIVSMALFNVPAGKKFTIRQLLGTYGPYLIKTSHYEIYQEAC